MSNTTGLALQKAIPQKCVLLFMHKAASWIFVGGVSHQLTLQEVSGWSQAVLPLCTVFAASSY